MKTIKISKEINLPLDIVTQTVAILAKRRVGKSYTMRRIAEQLLEANQQVVIVDPKGDQWGIRSSADGKKPGFPIVILGGEHGDAPLEVNSGEVVAKLVVEEHVSILIDLSSFRKHEIATFMAIFLENLYRLKAQEKHRTPVMLIVDEADAVAPQKPQKGEERMLGAIEDVVRRGGQRGIGCILVTQRSAVLNKNVLTQAQMLIVLRTIAPQDLSAMKAWIDVHGTLEEGKALMASLPSLPIGQAWFWSPGWPTDKGIFQLSQVLPISTFDSAATPKPGEKKVTPKNLADVDMEALKKQMKETIEKAKNDDPKVLKKRISELENELNKERGIVRKKEVLVCDPSLISKEVNKAVLEKEMLMERAFWLERDEWLRQIDNWFKILAEITKTVKDYHEELRKKPKKLYSTKITQPTIKIVKADPSLEYFVPKGNIIPGTEINGNEEITNPEQKILNAISFCENLGIKSVNVLVAFLAGYSPHTSSFQIARGSLGQKGLIKYFNGVFNFLEEGRNKAEQSNKPISQEELQESILSKLNPPNRKVLKILIDAYPNEVSNLDLATASGYSPSTSSYQIARGSLGSFGLIKYENGMARAEDVLFINH